ncbi:ABC transporter substrate-binding protein [Rhodococcus sp. OK302]|uniref:ABC transporter substrate-binding protein n=1 Tax=Rhodococcus sp. OK302 TaxID=1882769 RepID=UPI001595E17D|nr:ABC transporter substrate-binding protein [Rhodococcus sp. OK302]
MSTNPFVAAFLLTGLLLLTGCGSESNALEKDADGIATISVGHTPDSTVTLPFEVARREGFFESAKLRVNTVEAAGGPAHTAALIGGSTQISIGVPANVLTAMGEGSPIVVLPPYGKLDLYIAVPEDSPISTVEQLSGKKIGVSQRGAGGEKVATTILQADGIEATFIGVGDYAAHLAALRAGAIDAAVVTSDASGLFEVEGMKTRRVAGPAGELKELGLHTMYTTTRTFQQDEPDIVNAFCQSMKAAVEWIADPQNKDSAVAIIAEIINVPEPVAGPIWEQEHNYWRMQLDAAAWDYNVDWVLDGGGDLPFDSSVIQNCG